MILDIEKVFADLNSDLAECDRHLERGMFPQIEDDVRERRRELRDLKTWLVRLETYAAEKASGDRNG